MVQKRDQDMPERNANEFQRLNTNDLAICVGQTKSICYEKYK